MTQLVPFVAQNTGNNEWYTPPAIIERARVALGSIDLDPASCELAQANVRADTYYTVDQDGLAQRWAGRVWMNPPYARNLIAAFIEKLLSEPGVTAAVVLTNNQTDAEWCQRLLWAANAVCFVKGRVSFLSDGAGALKPLQGQIITSVGCDPDRFRRAFSDMGTVLRP